MKKKSIFLFVFFIGLILILNSCLIKEKKDLKSNIFFKNEFISQKIENNLSYFSLKKDIYAIELTFEGVIDKNKFKFNNVPFKIINYVNNTTIISISFGKLKKIGTNLFALPSNYKIIKAIGVSDISSTIKSSEDASQKLLGDFNHDSYVDITDFAFFKSHYRTKVSDNNYNPDYDIFPSSKGSGIFENIFSISNPDGIVNIFDFAVFAVNYRKSANRPPVIDILYPSQNDNIYGGFKTLKLKYTDPDLNNLVYDVYLNDKKVGENISSLEYTLDLDYPKNYLLTVIATDIVNSNVIPATTIATRVFSTIDTPAITFEYNKNDDILYLKGHLLSNIKALNIILEKNKNIKFGSAEGKNGIIIAYSGYNELEQYEIDLSNINDIDEGTIVQIPIYELNAATTNVKFNNITALNENIEMVDIDYSNWIEIQDDPIINPFEHIDLELHLNSAPDLTSGFYAYLGGYVKVKDEYQVNSIEVKNDDEVLFELTKNENVGNVFEGFYSIEPPNLFENYVNTEYTIKATLNDGEIIERKIYIGESCKPIRITSDIEDSIIQINQNFILQFEKTDENYSYSNSWIVFYDEERSSLINELDFDANSGVINIPSTFFENFEKGKRYLVEIWLSNNYDNKYRISTFLYYGEKSIIEDFFVSANTENNNIIIELYPHISDNSNIDYIEVSNESGGFNINLTDNDTNDNPNDYYYKFNISDIDIPVYENQDYTLTVFFNDGSSEKRTYHLGHIFPTSDLNDFSIISPLNNDTIPASSNVDISWVLGDNIINYADNHIDIHLHDNTDDSIFYSWNLGPSESSFSIDSSNFISGHKYSIFVLIWTNENTRITKGVEFYYGNN
ncbi:hypothetical protein JCM30566_11160 [Marinitoga arctica]